MLELGAASARRSSGPCRCGFVCARQRHYRLPVMHVAPNDLTHSSNSTTPLLIRSRSRNGDNDESSSFVCASFPTATTLRANNRISKLFTPPRGAAQVSENYVRDKWFGRRVCVNIFRNQKKSVGTSASDSEIKIDF